MRLDLRQEQSQKLFLTPQLKQALKILQLPVQELSAHVEQEVMDNPVLELAEPEEVEEEKRQEDEDSLDIEWEQYFHDCSDLGIAGEPDKPPVNCGGWSTEAPTLQDHLMMQLALLSLNEVETRIARYLIGNLDEQGYLCLSAAEAARDLKCSEKVIAKAIEVLQSLDPPGVAARNLVECLLIQAKQLTNPHPLLEAIIKNHLKLVAKGYLHQLARLLGVKTSVLPLALEQIKSLNPKPGRFFASENNVRYVIPDVIIAKVGQDYVVQVNDPSSTRLGINNLYRNVLTDPHLDIKAKKFINTKLKSALWLIKNIEQRRTTLYRVTLVIVEWQKKFLEEGVNYLRPLRIRQVAERLSIHESTVSRAVAGKYMQTPRGLFPMKYFFAGSPVKGDNITAVGIKKTIVEIISGENPLKPESDRQIALKLSKEGVTIARRTVAKYRDELGIPPNTKRKKI